MTAVEIEPHYTEELLRWGRSGSFYPSLILTPESKADIRLIQQQISGIEPSASLFVNLHATLFYCKPVRVFDYIREHIRSTVNEAMIYADLQCALAALILGGTLPNEHRRVRLATSAALEPFGDGNTVAMELRPETGMFGNLKDLIHRNLAYHGVSGSSFEQMAERPEFNWFLGESKPHISLATPADARRLGDIALPSCIDFEALSFGSTVMPDNIDPMRWLVMGG